MSGTSSKRTATSSSPVLHPTSYQLRSLVLDYLCHNCYISTAKAFARDSTVQQLDADGDEILDVPGDVGRPDAFRLSESLLVQIDLRKQIRIHILSGRVDEAIDLLNSHFPSVLSESKAESFPVIRTKSSDTEYVTSTSVEPPHLLLNLRILAFSEACRTVPLEYLPAGSSSLPSAAPPLEHESIDTFASSEQQVSLLTKAQKLYSLANSLTNHSDRARYLKELENVGGLLAYKVPEQSSMAKYLTMERREAVADQINRAILEKTGFSPISSLELITRYTSTLWSFARQYEARPTPGAVLPPVNRSSDKEDRDRELVPLFDLQQFLGTKP